MLACTKGHKQLESGPPLPPFVKPIRSIRGSHMEDEESGPWAQTKPKVLVQWQLDLTVTEQALMGCFGPFKG